LSTNLFFDEEAMSAGSQLEASVVLILRNGYGRVCKEAGRDSDTVVLFLVK
jgi:hypothetical protein